MEIVIDGDENALVGLLVRPTAPWRIVMIVRSNAHVLLATFAN